MADGDIHWYLTDREVGIALVTAVDKHWRLTDWSYTQTYADGTALGRSGGWHLVFRDDTDRLADWAPQAAALLRETLDGWDGGAVGAWTVEDWDRWAARVRALLAELEAPDA